MNRLKLFVGNLPAETGEQDLRAVFEPFGEVREVHIMSSARSRLGFACAFVVFGAGAQVDDAIEALNGKHKFGTEAEAITVSHARDAEPKKAREANWNQQGGQQAGGADQMWQYQQYYAAQLAMMQMYGGMYPGMAGGAGGGGAMAALYGGYNPYSGFGGAGGGGAYPAGFETPDAGGDSFAQPSKESEDAKLFLGGLPAGVTESEIRTVFSQVGTVKEVHIMHGKSQSGQACAFVVYPDLYSAQLAIRTLNKTPWHSAPDQPPIIVRAADKVQKKKGGAKEVSAAMLKDD